MTPGRNRAALSALLLLTALGLHCSSKKEEPVALAPPVHAKPVLEINANDLDFVDKNHEVYRIDRSSGLHTIRWFRKTKDWKADFRIKNGSYDPQYLCFNRKTSFAADGDKEMPESDGCLVYYSCDEGKFELGGKKWCNFKYDLGSKSETARDPEIVIEEGYPPPPVKALFEEMKAKGAAPDPAAK
jgi:hypothetical protein